MSNKSFEVDFEEFKTGFDREMTSVVLGLMKNTSKSRRNFLNSAKKRVAQEKIKLNQETYYSHLLPLLQDILDEFESDAPQDLANQWIDRLESGSGKWSASLPKSGMYPQKVQCFQAQPGDNLYLRIGKWTKRTNHRLKSLFASKDQSQDKQNEYEGWDHEVKWDAAALVLRVELLAKSSEILSAEWVSRSRIADLLVNLCDIEPTPESLNGWSARLDEIISEVSDQEAASKSLMIDFVADAMSRLCTELEFSGTIQENKKALNPVRNKQKLDRAQSEILTLQEKWNTDYSTRISQLRIDIGLHQFNLSVRNITQSLGKDQSTVLEQTIADSANKTQEFLLDLADQFQSSKTTKARIKELVTHIKKAETDSLGHFNQNFTSVIQKALDGMDFAGHLEQSFSDILLADELLPSATQVFNSSGKVVKMPATDVVKINFRSELTTYLKNDLLRKLRKVPLSVQDKLESIVTDAEEVVEIVQVNLNLASNLLENDDEDADLKKVLSLIHDGLDRAAKRSGEISAKVTELSRNIQNLIESPTTNYIDLCNDIMLKDRYLYIRTKNKEALVYSTAIDWKSRLTSNWFKFLDVFFVRYRFTVRSTGNIIHKVRKTLGFHTEDGKTGFIQPGAAEFLAETEQKLAELPLIYRRLFSSEALQDERFYKGRHTVMSLFEDSYRQWSRKHFANMVIIGEKGSGKTSCLRVLPKKISIQHEIITASIEKTTWFEAEIITKLSEILHLGNITDRNELISKINSGSERKVVFLEGFQNMYLRTIQGFEALEAFLLVLSQTGTNIFWVVTSSRYGWDYLNKIYQTAGYFTHQRKIDNVTSEVIEDIIMSRHKVSGYDLVFIPSDEMKSTRAYKKTESDPVENQKLIRNDFFKSLSNIAEGNISIALQYWLRSIQNTGLDVIEIAPFNNVKVSLGDGFTNDDLFTLGALVMHDDLNVMQLANVLNTNEKNSRLILSKLHARSILIKIDERFYLNQLLYRHVVNMLKSKNIIH